jgi:hypothetical protein
MPGKATSKPSLLDQARACKPKNVVWENSLTDEQRAEVLDVLRAVLSGELTLSFPQIVKLFNDNGLNASKHRVRGAVDRLKSSKG